MALFSKRSPRTSRRALRRAHTRTLKARAHAERAFDRSAAKKAAKARSKADKTAAKLARKTKATPSDVVVPTAVVSEQVATRRAARKGRKDAPRRTRTGAATARNYLAAAQVLAPVLAPFAYRATASLRGQLDAARARRMGVAVEQLGAFSGHGATLSARIAGLEPALEEMTRTHIDSESTAFRENTIARLAELSTAVHAAERMPTSRRRSAHRAIATDLDRVDADVLRRLGVRGS